ncbi:seipin-1 [Momordica charantia]|uniref:Seipin-1 n=1 Tax=Momordica charantia TaxID=3673 RepID=A0A6J1D9G7_MOMCH|nr:seipin-1 [Momordica charantia]
MDSDDEHEESGLPIPAPTDFFNKLIFLAAELIYAAIAFVLAPISTLLSLLSESFLHAEEAKQSVESAVRRAPSDAARRVRLAARRVSYGLAAAALVCVAMVVLLAAAAGASAAAMRAWMEEPVMVRERLNFDYTQAQPRAVFGAENNGKKNNLGIPVGHRFTASVILLMPESDFNRHVGVFQLRAELISTNGNIITSSSLPCMLRFRSRPVRLTRTFLASIPLVLGISTESQELTFHMLKHKEVNHQRSKAIRVTIIPRVGTLALPELYEARIHINSQLPPMKQLLHRWRWTCYLWTTFYTYLVFLVMFMYFWKPVVFRAASLKELSGNNRGASASREAEESFDDMADITVELLRKWQEMRRKRKAAMFAYREVGEVKSDAKLKVLKELSRDIKIAAIRGL